MKVVAVSCYRSRNVKSAALRAREPRLVARIKLARRSRSVMVHRLDQRTAGGCKPQRHVAVGLGIFVSARRPHHHAEGGGWLDRIEPVLLVDCGALQDAPLALAPFQPVESPR